MNFRKYSDIQLNYQEATAAQAEMHRSKAGKGIGNGWKGIWWVVWAGKGRRMFLGRWKGRDRGC